MRIIPLSATVLTFILLLLVYPGIYYNELTDAFISLMSQGLLTSGPVAIFNNYGSHFLLGHLYCWLNGIHAANWLGISLVLILIPALLLILWALRLSGNGKGRLSVWTMGTLTAAWVFHDVIFIQSTALSLYLIFFSLWIGLEFSENHFSQAHGKAVRFLLGILFLYGLLLRPLNIFLVFVIPLPPVLAIAILNDRKRILTLLVPVLGTFAAALLLVWLSNQAYTNTDREYARFAVFKSSVWDNGQPESSLKLHSLKDTVVFRSLAAYFIPEKDIFAPGQLSRIGIEQAHDPPEFLAMSVRNLPLKIDKAAEKWQELLNYPVRWYFLLSVVILLLLQARDRKAFLRQAGILSWFAFCLVLLSVLVKMEERVLIPVFTTMLLLLYRQTAETPRRTGLAMICLIITAWWGIAYMRSEFRDALERRKGQQSIENLEAGIRKKYPGRLVMLDAFSLNVLGNRLMPWKAPDRSIAWFTADPGYLIFYPEYAERQRSLTGTAGLPGLIRYIRDDPDRAIFIGIGDRITLLQRYCSVIHREEIRFGMPEPVLETGNILSGKVPYFLYLVKTD